MLKKQQNYPQIPSCLNLSIYLTMTILALSMNSKVCQAFSRTAVSKPLDISLPDSSQISTDLTISQAFPLDPTLLTPILESSSAFIEVIPGLLPMDVYEEPEAPTGRSPDSLSSGDVEPISTGSSETIPPPFQELFSLKNVRQSANIALPSEEVIASLPELSLNRMYPGVVGQSDHEINGRRVDFYQFEGNQDQQIVVVVRNSEDPRANGLPLKPYMMVFDPNGQVMAATVVPGSYRISTTDPLLPLDNQLALRLPQSGRYIVAVFADPGAGGRYGIGWKQDETRFRHDEIYELTNVESEPAEITGKAGQTIQIQANSYQFDPVITLVDANSNVIAEDDDDGGNYNARINTTLPADGIYRAIVSSANGRGHGQYRLRMR